MSVIRKKSSIWMKYTRVLMAGLLIFSMLLATGCGAKPVQPTEPALEMTPNSDSTEEGNAPAPEETEPEEPHADNSLFSLRQEMVETQKAFGVAYFGYHAIQDSDLPVDPFAVMQENADWLCEDLPFLMNIPKNRIIGERGDLFCIVPLDVDATLAVSKGYWDEENEQYIYDDILYSSDNGEPILLFCNDSGFEPDTQLYISGPSGEIVWYPQTDANLCAMPLLADNGENLYYDFSSYRELLTVDYRNMKGEWIMPTAQMLSGTTWGWEGFNKDGLEVRYQVTFQEDTLSVRWNDGINAEDHEFLNAAWDLTYDDEFAILTIDFREMAGVLRYNLLYHEAYQQMYFGIDVVQEAMPIGEEPLCRFLRPYIVPEPVEMLGLWELEWTELEGYREEVESGTCFIEITTDTEGFYRISFTDYAFPDENYTDKELVVFPFEMYDGCGNDQWSATVNYTGKYGTEYRITLLRDGTLLLQRYWEVEGAHMVSYGGYHRVK